METNIFTDNWETRLESQFLKNNRCCKKVYICSPLSAETDEEMLSNMQNARAYMFYAMVEMNVVARAPHAYLPMILCDRIPAERAAALNFGLQLLSDSDMLFVCGSRISQGMRGEILHAVSLNMPIYTFDDAVYIMVQKLVTQNGGSKSSVKFKPEHTVLRFDTPVSHIQNVGMFK